MEFFNKFKSKVLKTYFKKGVEKKEHTNRRERIKNRHLRKLDKLKLDKKKAHEDFHSIARNFFSEFFNVHYEFTHDELLEEIKKKKIKRKLREDIRKICNDMDNLSFNSTTVLKEELERLKEDFKGIVKDL